MHSMYGQSMSAPHTPTSTASSTPGTAGSGGFQQMGGQSALGGYHLQGGSYHQSLQSYATPSSMMPPSSTAMSLPQTIAPASAPSNDRLVPLRPITSAPPSLHAQHGMHLQLQPGMSSGYGPQSSMQGSETPTHVVGSQGRRGILPSAPGRPAVGTTGSGPVKNANIPAKDADGKFPCPHCTKTYLHAKHLKRHLLRRKLFLYVRTQKFNVRLDTGDRPYMCVLCRDTFSRSDILKRHFQKCSVRRGNPTGASHLSAQAHLKKSTSRSAVEDLLRNMNGVSNMPTDANLVPFGVIPDMPDRHIPDASTIMSEEHIKQEQIKQEQIKQEHGSRSNSLKRLSGGGGRNRRSLTGPGPGGSSRASFDQNHSADIPTTMSSSINPQLATFNMPNGHNGSSFNQSYDYTSQSNGTTLPPQDSMPTMTNGRGNMPMFGAASNSQQPGVDWSQMFQPGAQDGFMSSFNPNLAQNQIEIKSEPSMTLSNDGLFTGVYPITGGSIGTNAPGTGFPGWNMSFSQTDPFHQIATQIANFCFPPNAQVTKGADEVRSYLSADNIKHFLEQYVNFQGHFPLIHMPTFHITETYKGLLLAMICVGAVYSERITPAEVRELMEQAKLMIERDSRLFSTIGTDSAYNSSTGERNVGRNKIDLEEIQAIFLLHVLFTWHGTPVQREMARRQFPTLVKLARTAGLTRPSTLPESLSVPHQQNVGIEHLHSGTFDWGGWIEQEKRSRLYYTLFLFDSVMAMYFNLPPHFDSFGINLPLPADDAAWDAQSAAQCAEVLGSYGTTTTRERNIEGNGHARQPDLHSALKALMDPNSNLTPGTTNLYSKFILIHALHVQIWHAQRQLQDGEISNAQGMPFNRSGTGTPTSLNDWTVRSANGSVNGHVNNTSRRATPVDVEGQAQHSLMSINNALEKWKKAWDDDLATQYPRSLNSNRRFGFYRDGIHFYYLAKYLLKNRMDWHMAPDQRLTYVMNILKSVKTWVMSDSAKKGEELGSVSDIDQDYGVSDLTLDMAQLFKPINKQIDSPVAGVHTNIGNGGIDMVRKEGLVNFL